MVGATGALLAPLARRRLAMVLRGGYRQARPTRAAAVTARRGGGAALYDLCRGRREVTGISFRSPLLQAPEIHADAGAAR